MAIQVSSIAQAINFTSLSLEQAKELTNDQFFVLQTILR